MLFRGRNRSRSGKPLRRYADMVETVLKGIDVDVTTARTDISSGYGWTFHQGSAVIEITVVEQEGAGYLQVLAPIMHLPDAGLLPLYRRLLEYNLKLTNAALGIHLDTVYVFHERTLDGLDEDDTQAIITMVARYADDLDNTLVNEFGGRLYSQI